MESQHGRLVMVGALVLTICSSGIFAGLLISNVDYAEDDMVFLMGQWFNKIGKPPLEEDATQAEWFDQCMDHFKKPEGCRTKWKQRYWIREDYYQPGGPIFLQFGGQHSADGYIDTFYWHNYARAHKAMMIVLEHRFYGYSFPSRESTPEVLELKTSHQALADAANFIDRFKESRNLSASKWIAFGSSYAGNLAAWMKMQHPKHVKAAVSSSGPLLALYDFSGYMKTISNEVKTVDRDCYDKLNETFNCLESLINGSVCEGQSNASEIIPGLKNCSSVEFDDMLDREAFLRAITMYTWADPKPSRRIIRSCNMIKRINKTDVIKLYGNFLVGTAADGHCRVQLSTIPRQMTQKEIFDFIESPKGLRAGATSWWVKTCYEFGYYRSTSADSKTGLVGTLEQVIQLEQVGTNAWSGTPMGLRCPKEFGENFTREVAEGGITMTKAFYKEKDIDSKCVVFIKDGWNPWLMLRMGDGCTSSVNNTVVANSTEKAEHCDEPLFDQPSKEITKAQTFIRKQIGRYLVDPNC